MLYATTAQSINANAGSDTLLGIEGVIGGSGNDLLVGSIMIDSLIGGAGNDTLSGSWGNDVLDGGAGNDTAYYDLDIRVIANLATGTINEISGSTGSIGIDSVTSIETITTGNRSDSLTGDNNDNTLSAGDGYDTLDGGAGNDVLDGGLGTDTVSYAAETTDINVNLALSTAQVISANAGNDTLVNIEAVIGGAGNDLIKGNSSINTLNGSDGNDTLEGGAGNDYLDGGLGNDTAYYNSTVQVIANLDTRRINETGIGTDNVDSIEGISTGIGNDSLTGDSANNTLSAGDGNDTLEGGAGNDVLDGGLGNDTVVYGSTFQVMANLGTGTINEIGVGIDSVISIEAITTGKGDDSLTGDSADNSLTAGAGNDTLTGGAGNDVLDGGSGYDTISYATETTPVTINLAITTAQIISASVGSDTLSNFEVLIGGAGNDTLTGSSNAETLVGNAGNDILDGGSAPDTVSYATETTAVKVNLATTTAQVISASAGSDTLAGFEGIIGGSGNDTLTGGGNPLNENTLTGNAGNDVLTGNVGNDILEGGAGNDILAGGTGINQSYGGDGLDTFVLNAALGLGNYSNIQDFNITDDVIQLQNSVFAKLTTTGVLTAAYFKIIGSSALDTNDFITYNSSTGILNYDADGSGTGAAVKIAVLGSGLALTNADFSVI